jgi:hypothetical protein
VGRDLLGARSGAYDGARHVFLPGILSLVLSLLVQDPASRCTVSAGSGDVPERRVAAVRAEVAPALQQLAAVFRGLPQQSFRLIVHGSASDLPPYLAAGHHAGSPGFAIPARHEIHLLLAEIDRTGRGLRPVLVHELTHELLHQACAPWGDRLPRWFHEGIAQVLAKNTYLGASEEVIVWRATAGTLLPFAEIADTFPTGTRELQIAYAQSHSYVSWLERRFGVAALLKAARTVDRDRSFDLALVHMSDQPTAALLEGWRDHLLHGSGAGWRVLLQQFFGLSMVLALPLLALALIRRLRADRLARERLQRSETEGELSFEPRAEPPVDAPFESLPGEAQDPHAEPPVAAPPQDPR